MKKIFLITSLMLFLAVAVFAGLVHFGFLKPKPVTQPGPSGVGPFSVHAPLPGDTVTSPLEISGTVGGSGWAAFEGQAGTVQLLDSKGNELAHAVLQVEGDWMKLPADFSGTLYFDHQGTEQGKLVFHNENPSGMPENERTFTVPVTLGQSSSASMTVEAFFNNNKMDPEYSCQKVFPVQRTIPKTQATARAALNELLKGPAAAEQQAGFFTSINSGVKIQSLTIENGAAKIDFSSELDKNVAGSCKVSAIRAQITQTLMQFPTVKSVIISVNGNSKDILQP